MFWPPIDVAAPALRPVPYPHFRFSLCSPRRLSRYGYCRGHDALNYTMEPWRSFWSRYEAAEARRQPLGSVIDLVVATRKVTVRAAARWPLSHAPLLVNLQRGVEECDGGPRHSSFRLSFR